MYINETHCLYSNDGHDEYKQPASRARFVLRSHLETCIISFIDISHLFHELSVSFRIHSFYMLHVYVYVEINVWMYG